MDESPTVFVVDDEVGMRKSLQYLIESAGIPVRSFESATSFLNSVSSSAAGCLLLDIRMPGMTGMELQQKLFDNGNKIPIILITAHGEIRSAVQAMSLGAFDYIEKPVDGDVLINRIRLALELDEQTRRKHAAKRGFFERLEKLTRREREVYELVITGKQTKHVAADLDLSFKTVESHRSNIMRKMEVKSITELIHIALSMAAEEKQ
ncbi:MAG: response regulator transcription factor [Planctomycetaceae bacterium]